MKVKNPDRFETAKKIFRDRGGVLKTGEALCAGIHPRTLYEMERSAILEKLAQWRGFIRRNRLTNAEEDLGQVIKAIAVFLRPVAKSLAEEKPFEITWKAPGPWA